MYDHADGMKGEQGGLPRRLPTNPEEYARSHPLRVSILTLLARDRGRERTAADLRDELPEAPGLSTVAYHLKVLHRFGLVCERKGNTIPLYSLV